MSYSILKLLLFFVSFGLSFYACSAIQFEKIMKVRQPQKVVLMLFLLSLIMGYLATQAILELTIMNGIGM